MKHLISACLILAGLINVFPVIGIASAEVLARLYGIAQLEGDLLLLMRHRALLFGILGVVIFVSVARPHLQPTAISAGLTSMLGFLVLAALAGDTGARLQGVIWADVIGSVALLVCAGLRRKARASNQGIA